MKEIRELLFGEGYDPYDKLKLLPLDMQGWNSQASIFGRIIEELKPKLIVEVGTWKGASAIHMAKECLKYTDDFEIVCIDTWLGSVEHWSGVSQELPRNDFINGRPNLYNQFLSNIVHNNLEKYITPFPVDSINGGLTLELMIERANAKKPDLIYIDAGHEYFSVKCDFYLYSKLVRDGGRILGDDFHHGPVSSAARETFGDDKVVDAGESKFVWIK